MPITPDVASRIVNQLINAFVDPVTLIGRAFPRLADRPDFMLVQSAALALALLFFWDSRWRGYLVFVAACCLYAVPLLIG